jgi:hypothetical protein
VIPSDRPTGPIRRVLHYFGLANSTDDRFRRRPAPPPATEPTTKERRPHDWRETTERRLQTVATYFGLAGGPQGNGDTAIRARIQAHWKASEAGDIEAEHAIYAYDAILDYPQSGERFRGRAKIQAQRGGHPADRHFTIRRISGAGALWVSECTITYDGAPTHSVSIMKLGEHGLVTHETQYFADPFPASPDRAALAEPIDG